MPSDHAGCLRPCPRCQAEVIRAVPPQGWTSSEPFCLERQTVTDGPRYASRGVEYIKALQGYYMHVLAVQTAPGYPVHHCKGTADGPLAS